MTKRGEQDRGFLGLEATAGPFASTIGLDVADRLRSWVGPGWDDRPLKAALREAR